MTFHVGISGAGLGGLAAAIAIARVGAQVTVLEAAHELGEIGAGIQMTPNVARLLREWDIDKAIGENLVQIEELNMRRKDGTKIGWTPISRVEEAVGQPWWLVHRHHLHQGLVKVARKNGVMIHIASRITHIDHESNEQVRVQTESGKDYTFDFLIGADGVHSITRHTLFPTVEPSPPSNNSAYRAIVPYAQIRQDPLARELIEKKTMEVWMGDKAYIITYPISAGNDFNMVLSHHTPHPTYTTTDVPIAELRAQYHDFDPRIKRIVDMIKSVQRWPLLVTGPLERWSSAQKNVVLIGDAAHSMVNHMAQGAATSMEDGAFLARCLAQVVRGRLGLADAVAIYERARMPLALRKQQVSFLNGAIWHLPDGPAQRARDAAMAVELRNEPFLRSPNLYGDPRTVLEVYGYDAERHAEWEVENFLAGREVLDEKTKVTRREAARCFDWFLPESDRFEVKAKV